MAPTKELIQLTEHLNQEVQKESREGNFDLDDIPERVVLEPFHRLKGALNYIEQKVVPVWKEADGLAIKHQSRHRKLAKVAIFTGTSAIFFAVIQMAVARQIPSFVTVTLTLEILAVLTGVVAVVIGIRSKGDKIWLAERNRAERLRMLKFQALGWASFLNNDLAKWTQEVDDHLSKLDHHLLMDEVNQWTQEYQSTNEIIVPVAITNDDNLNAVSGYYLVKRLKFQAKYFEKQSKKHVRAALPWRHLSLPIFIASTICVLIHFLSGWLIIQLTPPGSENLRYFLEGIEIWSLALAAIIPVLGLSTRVWLGAFEPHRSANLYNCKLNAVFDIMERMSRPDPDAASVIKYINEGESLFENEHREWLRLMFETEWML
jgi:hypothetical protein